MASEPFRADVWFVHGSCTFVVWFDNMGVSQIGQAHVVCPRLEAGALIFSWLVKLRDAHHVIVRRSMCLAQPRIDHMDSWQSLVECGCL